MTKFRLKQCPTLFALQQEANEKVRKVLRLGIIGSEGSEDASDVYQSEINSTRDKILYYGARVFSINGGSAAVRSIFIWKGICVKNWSLTIVILESFQDQQWPHYDVGSVLADLPVWGLGGQGFYATADFLSRCGTWIATGIWYCSWKWLRLVVDIVVNTARWLTRKDLTLWGLMILNFCNW